VSLNWLTVANIFALTVIAYLGFEGTGVAGGGVQAASPSRCTYYYTYCLPAFGDIEADLGVTSPAATFSFVVPPFVFQFVQEALFIQF